MLKRILNYIVKKFFCWKDEKLKVHGTVRLIGSNYDKDGVLRKVLDRKLPNLITNAGFDLIADCLGKNDQPPDITKIAIGDGVAGDATATALTSQTDIQDAAYAHTPGTKTFTFTATFETVVAATEYGCLNTTPTLFNTAGFTAITVDNLEIVCTITLS